MVVGVVLGGFVAAAPANADTTGCPSGYSCIWADQNYLTSGSSTHYRKFQQWMADYHAYNYEGTSQNSADSATSVYNNGNYEKARFFDDWHGYGSYFELPIKTGDAHLNDSTGAAPGGHDNKLSSGLFQSYYGTHPWT